MRGRARAKAKQVAKLAELRAALIAVGFDTARKQAAALGLNPSTAWSLLHRDTRAGPSAIIIKRILSSPKLPASARRKVEEYIREKSRGLYGHSERRSNTFADQFPDLT